MPEWVKNKSDKPIPEPYVFSPDHQKLLFVLQRRKHLEKFDAKTGQMPLCSLQTCPVEHNHERDMLEALEAVVEAGATFMFRGVELTFAPGQIYQVPDGVGAALAAKSPEKLVVLRWEDVRHLNNEPGKLHFQTRMENLRIIAESDANQEDSSLHHGSVSIEMKDGRQRMGDSKQWDAASAALAPDVAAAMANIRVH